MPKNDKIIVPTPLLVILTLVPVLILIFASLALVSKIKTPPKRQSEEIIVPPPAPDTAAIAAQEERFRESVNLNYDRMQQQLDDLVERQKIERDLSRSFK